MEYNNTAVMKKIKENKIWRKWRETERENIKKFVSLTLIITKIRVKYHHNNIKLTMFLKSLFKIDTHKDGQNFKKESKNKLFTSTFANYTEKKKYQLSFTVFVFNY